MKTLQERVQHHQRVVRRLTAGLSFTLSLTAFGALIFFTYPEKRHRYQPSTQRIQDGQTKRLVYYLNHNKNPVVIQGARAQQRDSDQVFLYDGVALRLADGTRLKTDQAHVSFTQKAVTGNTPLKGQGPMGSLEGERFSIEQDGNLLTLEGQTTLTFRKGL
jgi:hypothetical protein